MKTVRLIMIATVLTIGMLGITAVENVDARTLYGNKALHIDLEDAVQNPALVQIMYDQLNPNFLGSVDGEYTVSVLYQGIMVYITGSYTEWFTFFQMKKLINTQEMEL